MYITDIFVIGYICKKFVFKNIVKNKKLAKNYLEYAISQLRIVRSGLHLVTYLDVGNFCDKRTKKTLHEICVQGFLRFSYANKPSQSVSLIYELA